MLGKNEKVLLMVAAATTAAIKPAASCLGSGLASGLGRKLKKKKWLQNQNKIAKDSSNQLKLTLGGPETA